MLASQAISRRFFSQVRTQNDQYVEKYQHCPVQRRSAHLPLNSHQPIIRVRQVKGSRSRIVPVNPELLNALAAVLQFAGMERGPIVGASRSTAWRWAQEAAARAKALGALTEGRTVGTHTFRHSYARHLLLHGVPINYVSRRLVHRSIQTTLIYLELVPDPVGRLSGIP